MARTVRATSVATSTHTRRSRSQRQQSQAPPTPSKRVTRRSSATPSIDKSMVQGKAQKLRTSIRGGTVDREGQRPGGVISEDEDVNQQEMEDNDSTPRPNKRIPRRSSILPTIEGSPNVARQSIDPPQQEPIRKKIAIRKSLVQTNPALVRPLKLVERAEAFKSFGGHCVNALLAENVDFVKVDSAIKALEGSKALIIVSPSEMPFFHFSDLQDLPNGTVRGPLPAAIHLSNISSLLRIVMDPEAAAEAFEYKDSEDGMAGGVKALLRHTWREFMGIAVPSSRWGDPNVVTLLVDFATQRYLLATPTDEEHQDVRTRSTALHDLFSPSATNRLDLWENWKKAGGDSEMIDNVKKKIQAGWKKQAMLRSAEIERSDLETLQEEFPYEAFRSELFAFVRANISSNEPLGLLSTQQHAHIRASNKNRSRLSISSPPAEFNDEEDEVDLDIGAASDSDQSEQPNGREFEMRDVPPASEMSSEQGGDDDDDSEEEEDRPDGIGGLRGPNQLDLQQEQEEDNLEENSETSEQRKRWEGVNSEAGEFDALLETYPEAASQQPMAQDVDMEADDEEEEDDEWRINANPVPVKRSEMIRPGQLPDQPEGDRVSNWMKGIPLNQRQDGAVQLEFDSQIAEPSSRARQQTRGGPPSNGGSESPVAPSVGQPSDQNNELPGSPPAPQNAVVPPARSPPKLSKRADLLKQNAPPSRRHPSFRPADVPVVRKAPFLHQDAPMEVDDDNLGGDAGDQNDGDVYNNDDGGGDEVAEDINDNHGEDAEDINDNDGGEGGGRGGGGPAEDDEDINEDEAEAMDGVEGTGSAQEDEQEGESSDDGSDDGSGSSEDDEPTPPPPVRPSKKRKAPDSDFRDVKPQIPNKRLSTPSGRRGFTQEQFDLFLVDERGEFLHDDDGTPLLVNDNYLGPFPIAKGNTVVRNGETTSGYRYVRKSGQGASVTWPFDKALLLYRETQKIPIECTQSFGLVMERMFGIEGNGVLNKWNQQHMRAKMKELVKSRNFRNQPVDGNARFFLNQNDPRKIIFEEERAAAREDARRRIQLEVEEEEARLIAEAEDIEEEKARVVRERQRKRMEERRAQAKLESQRKAAQWGIDKERMGLERAAQEKEAAVPEVDDQPATAVSGSKRPVPRKKGTGVMAPRKGGPPGRRAEPTVEIPVTRPNSAAGKPVPKKGSKADEPLAAPVEEEIVAASGKAKDSGEALEKAGDGDVVDAEGGAAEDEQAAVESEAGLAEGGEGAGAAEGPAESGDGEAGGVDEDDPEWKGDPKSKSIDEVPISTRKTRSQTQPK